MEWNQGMASVPSLAGSRELFRFTLQDMGAACPMLTEEEAESYLLERKHLAEVVRWTSEPATA